MVPRRPPRPCCRTARRVDGSSRCALAADWCQIASRRADPVQVETLTPPGWHGLRYAALFGMDP